MKLHHFVFMLLCISNNTLHIYAENTTSTQNKPADFESVVIEDSIELKKIFADFQLSTLHYQSDKMMWFPESFFLLNPKFGSQNSDNYFISFPLTVGISQKLPLLSSLSLSLTQPFSFNIFESTSLYGFSADISIQSNAAFFIPELAYSYWNEEKSYINKLLRQIDLQYETNKKIARKSYLMCISYFLYYKELAVVYKHKNALCEEKSKEDAAIYRLGQISSLEFAEREKQRIQTFTAYIQSLEQSIQYETQLMTAGITTEHSVFSFREWIDYLETIVANYNVYDQNEKELQIIQTQFTLKNTLESHIKNLPAITCTYTLTPSSQKNNTPFMFWQNLSMPQWSLSFSTRLSVAPWDKSYSVQDAVKLEQHKYEMNMFQLQQKIKNELVLREKKQHLLSILEDKNEQHYMLELQRYKLYQELYIAGRMSKMDIAFQNLLVQESFINWYFSKLNKIEHLLSFY